MVAIVRLGLLALCMVVYAVEGNDRAALIERLLTQPSYNKKVRPGLSEGVPTTIILNFYIQSISEINDVSMDYSVSIFMRQLWQDKRLAFTEYPDELILNYDQLDYLWVPDLFVKNEKKSRFHDITVPNRLIKLYPNGTIYFSQRLSLTLSCDMALANYPMDVQECAIEMESYGYTTKDIIFEWKSESAVQVNPMLTLPEFHLDNTSIIIDDCTQVYITGSFTCQVAKFRLVRQFQFYLVQVFIPTLLVVGLSWVSFWIDSASVPARISLGLLTVLTMTTQSSSISSRLPRVSYVKAIDIWMTACLSFVFGALLEYSIVNYLARQDTKRKAQGQFKSIASKAVIASKRDSKKDVVIKVHPCNDEDALEPKEAFTEESRTKSSGSFRAYMNKMRTDRALFVDVISRFLFPGIFLIFNIGYWTVYRVPNTTLHPEKL